MYKKSNLLEKFRFFWNNFFNIYSIKIKVTSIDSYLSTEDVKKKILFENLKLRILEGIEILMTSYKISFSLINP